MNASNVAERIFSRRMFREKVAQAMNLDRRVTDSDLSVILIYLSRYKGVIIYDDDASFTFSFFGGFFFSFLKNVDGRS